MPPFLWLKSESKKQTIIHFVTSYQINGIASEKVDSRPTLNFPAGHVVE